MLAKFARYAKLEGIINTEDDQRSIQGAWGTSEEQMPGKSCSMPLLRREGREVPELSHPSVELQGEDLVEWP